MSVASAAKRLARVLKEKNVRVVFAESCTAGSVAAALYRHPGISEYLCGSAVTYRCETKIGWLGVARHVIEKHTAVSETVARQMAIGVLRTTDEADIAASVTGHLGPHAPVELDGVIYVGVARRKNGKVMPIGVHRFVLQTSTRLARQREAAELVLTTLRESLD